MANIEKAVRSRLAAYSGLTDLVSTRIYPLQAPQNPTFPLVTFQVISTVRVHAMGSDTGDVASVVQVQAWDDTNSGARDVIEQVRGALQDYSGMSGGVTIQRAFIENEYPRGYDLATKAFGWLQQYRIWHKE